MSENHQPAPQDCLEEAVASFRRSTVPERPPDDAVLARIRALTEPLTIPPRVTFIERIRRMNPILRYGIIAAVVTCTILLGIDRQSETVVLADVTDAVKKHKVVRFKMIQDVIGQKGQTMTMTVYLELSLNRIRMEMDDGKGNPVINILDMKQKKLLGFFPKDKKAFRMDMQGTRKTADSFFGWLEKVRTDKNIQATEELLFGKDVLVYRLKENNGKTDLTVYVDPKTKLPVQVERKSKAPIGSPYDTWSDFVWDPKTDDSTFSIEPPVGYEFTDVPPAQPRETKKEQ